MGHIAILGGTGPEGLGLGLRFALCGEEVRLGSRSGERAETAAREAAASLRAAGCETPVSGAENAATLEGADLVVLAFPFAGVEKMLPALASRLAGKIVLDAINPLKMAGGTFRSQDVPAGSAAELIGATLPRSKVVSAFKNESAEDLKNVPHPLHGDVLVCGDDAGARRTVIELVARVPDLRPVDAGALVNARALESLTALLLNLNRRHKTRTSVRILGLDEKRV